MTSPTPSADFKYIRAWGMTLGLNQYYIDREVEVARRDNAPIDAIYQRDNGSWATFNNIQHDDTKAIVHSYVESIK